MGEDLGNELMTIGSFAFRTGLSIPALRHYDEVDVLRPAYTDPHTGYRRYHPDQVDTARLICKLRSVDLPVDEIRQVLATEESIESALTRHRRRLAAELRKLHRMTTAVDEFLDKGVPMPEHANCRPVQVTIHADDVPKAVAFYAEMFDGEYLEQVSSFQFGAPNTDTFFLLTIEQQAPEHPGYPPRGTCFGFLVDDLDHVHQRALDAGASEVQPPMELEWKPRTSIVDDLSGNRLALFQA